MDEIRSPDADDPGQTQLSLSSSLLAQAEALGIDAAQAAAAGIRRAVMNAQVSRYVEEHRAAAAAWNHYVARDGQPFGDIMEQPI